MERNSIMRSEGEMHKISIIVPVYNTEPYLRRCVDSVLSQDFSDFELILVDDGSTDECPAICDAYAAQDDRVRIIQKTGDKGIAFSLNMGLEQARGEYIARMDADDVSLPERLETQVAFMDAHPDVDICGSRVTYLCADKRKRPACSAHPLDNDAIHAMLLFCCALAHPTIVFRAASVHEYGIRYSTTCYAEDYALWDSMASVVKFANIEKPLLQYRLLESGLSHNPALTENARDISLQALRRIGAQLSNKEERYIARAARGAGFRRAGLFRSISRKITSACAQTGYCSDSAIQAALSCFLYDLVPSFPAWLWGTTRYRLKKCMRALRGKTGF